MAATMPSTPNDAPNDISTDPMEKEFKHEERSDERRVNRGHAKSHPRRNGNKKRDMGRAEWSRNPVNKRARNEKAQEATKRRKLNSEDDQAPIYATQFSKEEIESEGRKPKRKVAVMIGYSGSGYRGLQLNHRVRTIEGDLFTAFVAAGAISKANGDDPKKSSLIRCARTDKGVHAAGNLISLKLIIEDPDIVQKINERLSPQIRVFSIQRTTGAFSAYQSCDSRIYEYLIPTHAFLPPHPASFLGKRLVELAEEENDVEGYRNRQNEVSTFWEETEERCIKPILEQLDPSIRSQVLDALYNLDTNLPEIDIGRNNLDEGKHKDNTSLKSRTNSDNGLHEPATKGSSQQKSTLKAKDADQQELNGIAESDRPTKMNTITNTEEQLGLTEDISLLSKTDIYTRITELATEGPIQQSNTSKTEGGNQPYISKKTDDSVEKSTTVKAQGPVPQLTGLEVNDAPQSTRGMSDPIRPTCGNAIALDLAIKNLKAAYITAKNAYRIHPKRLERIRSILSRFVGSQNYYNYTIQKSFKDPSAKRVIRSFVVHDQPILINGTEWLSLKVHGQSFMMHQIRKMVSMAALVVRCGCHEGRLQDSYLAQRISIPKAPGLGLLLERPVFDIYNANLTKQQPPVERESIDFSKFDREIEEFKQREIYERIFREEERDHLFHAFFASIDNLKSSRLLYLSSVGLAATARPYAFDQLEPELANEVIEGLSGEDEEVGDGEDG